MARDLIPPPSPAGRPGTSADAERERSREREEATARQKGGLWHRSPEAEATENQPAAALAASDPQAPAAPAPAPRERTPSPYRSRFGLLLGVLVGLAVAAGAIGAALFVGSGTTNDARDGWSSWKPTSDEGLGAAKQIASHVGGKYRMKDNSQLVGVQAGPFEISDKVPLESVALRTAPEGGNIEYIKGEGLIYTLNGLGPNGSISVGKPSPERHLLLRREALELALYTFRYVKDVDLVVALLPPKPPPKAKKGAIAVAPAETPKQALFFRPGDLQPQLEIPINATIPRTTPIPEAIPGGEAQRIDALTRGNLFLASFQQSQDLKAYLVLDRSPG